MTVFPHLRIVAVVEGVRDLDDILVLVSGMPCFSG